MPTLSRPAAALPPLAEALRDASRRAGDPPAVVDALAAAGARLAAAAAEGHSCLLLTAADAPLIARITRSPLLRRSTATLPPGQLAPLVLDDAVPEQGLYRLYFARAYAREARVARGLAARLRHPLRADAAVRLAERLAARFGDDPRQADQKAAVARAAENGLTLIAGGPGTGKTTTVVTLLAILRAEFPDLRIALAAPTGKAAARLAEAVATGPEIPGDPPHTGTLHRLLGLHPQPAIRPGALPGPVIPLPWDLIVVDEASMIDLALGAQLVERLAPTTRLVLLGDPDQLASVAAGAVFAELVAAAAQPGGPLDGTLARLAVSHRFDSGAQLGRMADAVRRGDADAALKRLENPDVSLDGPAAALDLEALAASYGTYVAIFAAWAARGYPGDDASALAALGRTRVLAALRRGPRGVERLNAALDARLMPALTGRSWRPAGPARFPGQPLMIVRNAPELDLYNGDTGLIIDTPRGLAVVFPDPDNGTHLRTVPLSHLPAAETAWVTTVHKAQGSEFDTVTLILPDLPGGTANPLLTRELLYTGLTRARQTVHLIADAAALRAAIDRPTQRQSGLQARLASAGSGAAAPA